MSVQASSRVMEFSEAQALARLVLMVMANRAGGDFDECFASVDRLAFECRIDTRTVQRAIGRLVKAGDLAYVGIHPKHRTNIYRVMPAQTVSMFPAAGVAESHPPVTSDAPAPPELKELRGLGSSTASSSSHPTSVQDKPAPNGRYPAVFEDFWTVYPLHVGKRAAFRRWKEALRRADTATIIAGAIRYRKDPNRRDEFTKYAEGWLNADGWLDDPLPARKSANLRPDPPRPFDPALAEAEIERARNG